MTSPQRPPGRPARRQDLRLLLLVVAVAAALVFTLDGFTVLHWPHDFGWLGIAIVALDASFLV